MLLLGKWLGVGVVVVVVVCCVYVVLMLLVVLLVWLVLVHVWSSLLTCVLMSVFPLLLFGVVVVLSCQPCGCDVAV